MLKTAKSISICPLIKFTLACLRVRQLPLLREQHCQYKLHFPHDCIGCVVNRSVLVLFFLKSGYKVRKINLYGQIFLNIIYVACFLNCLTVVGFFLATGFDVPR